MDEHSIQKYGEIQYLKGRLDELHKAFPTVYNLERSRKLDGRIQKYYDKLKSVDEIAYHLYLVEINTRRKSKERSKNDMKSLLEEVLVTIEDGELKTRILQQIEKY
jgi:hypothetical protein